MNFEEPLARIQNMRTHLHECMPLSEQEQPAGMEIAATPSCSRLDFFRFYISREGQGTAERTESSLQTGFAFFLVLFLPLASDRKLVTPSCRYPVPSSQLREDRLSRRYGPQFPKHRIQGYI